MPIAMPRAALVRGWPRLSARGALAAAPASIPNTAVRILPVIALDLEVYSLDCMLALQTLLLFFIRCGLLRGSGSGALDGRHNLSRKTPQFFAQLARWKLISDSPLAYFLRRERYFLEQIIVLIAVFIVTIAD